MSEERKSPPGFMSKAQAMELLGCGRWALESSIDRGELKAKKLFNRIWISRESVEALLRIDERAA